MTEYIQSKFKTTRIVDGKLRKVIVDIFGGIINKNPTKDELKELKPYIGNFWNYVKNLPAKEKKEYLLGFIRYFHFKEKRVPTCYDFTNNLKYPSFNIYINVFGSWNDAIREAGLNLFRNCTDEELLDYPIKFYEENGKPPTERDFNNNPKYPNSGLYLRRFGWQKALKIIGLGVDSMVRRGIIDTNQQKGRLGELFVIDHFEEIGAIDKAGENCKNSYDGICPKGYNYDVKTSKYHGLWDFHLTNINIDEIEWFYLLAFNSDYTELLYAWRAPAIDFIEDIEKGRRLQIGINSDWKRNLENMKEYLITERIKPIFERWLTNIKNQDNSKESIVKNAREKIFKVHMIKDNMTDILRRRYELMMGFIETLSSEDDPAKLCISNNWY